MVLKHLPIKFLLDLKTTSYPKPIPKTYNLAFITYKLSQLCHALPNTAFNQSHSYHVAKWIRVGLKVRRSGVYSQCWPCVEMPGKLQIPHCLGPPSHNGYLVHRSKVGSIVAGCTGSHLARGKVKAVEHALSWSMNSKELPLPLSLPSMLCS